MFIHAGRIVLGALALLTLPLAPATAGTITVLNPGFEELVLSGPGGQGNFAFNNIPFWDVDVTGQAASYLNPEGLPRKDTLGRLGNDLATALGAARTEKLLEVPEKRLSKEIDAIIGAWVVAARSRR